MNRETTRYLLFMLLMSLNFPVEAQQPPPVIRVGFLHAGSISVRLPHLEMFRQGLREHGYIEGKNLAVEVRFAEGKLDRLSDLAGELAGLKVDVIAAGTTRAMQGAKKTTATIPIVMVGASDPVSDGLVAGLARPGGRHGFKPLGHGARRETARTAEREFT